MSAHFCHARNCKTSVRPSLFMCRKHWYMVPKDLRDAIWENYRPGQEITKDPSDEYVTVSRAAIEAVAQREGLSA